MDSGYIALGADVVLANSTGNMNVLGVISSTSGNFGVSRTGSGGTLFLTGANTYTGSSGIMAGTVAMNNLGNIGVASSLGPRAAANSAIALGGASTYSAFLVYTGTRRHRHCRRHLRRHRRQFRDHPTVPGALVAAAVVSGAELRALRGNEVLFDNVPVRLDDLLARFSLAGDANLDGKISMDDYLAIDSGIRFGGNDWAHGDFSRDGAVGVADYALIDFNAAIVGLSLGQEMQELHALQFGSAYTSALEALTPVPEPTSLALLGLGAAALLRRRKSR